MKGWKRAAKILLPILFWGALWCLAAWRVDQVLLLPSPWAVLRRLFELAGTKLFWLTAGNTLLRVLCGTGAGVVLGTLVAAASARWFVADWLAGPMVKILRATPVASFIVLVWLWSPTAWVPGVVSCVMTLPVVWANVSQGIASADPKLRELCRDYRFSRWKTVRRLYIPSALPAFITGCRTALGLSWKAGVAAEVLCLPKQAVGSQVYYAKLYLETPDLFAWTVVVIILSFLVEKGLGALLERGVRHGAP